MLGPLCDLGYFGDACLSQCHCADKKSCQYLNGTCQSPDCLPGWKGPACDKACDEGNFGQNCSQNCSGHCINGNSQCSYIDGRCLMGCNDGYLGEKCNQTCPHSRYGKNCTETCDTCKQNKCQNTDGVCTLGCKPGYKPDGRCPTPCDNGSYGQNCSYSCSGNCLLDKTVCIKTKGTCRMGCERGYVGSKCDIRCKNGAYGFDCNETCHSCKKETVCDFRSGDCPDGCRPGFNGSRCDQACLDGYFGDCTRLCHCKDDKTCNRTDGVCLNGCDFGWRGHNCSLECKARTFGQDCRHTCHCKNQTNCDRFNGTCNTSCDPGWRGLSCDMGCTKGTYGFNCNESCHNCLKGSICDFRNGNCPSGCSPGFDGSRCDKVIDTQWHRNNYSETSMSSEVGNWSSDRAVDGDIGPDADKCQCCSGTENSHLSWWKLDFGEIIPINRLVVYSKNNEKDFRQLDGFQLGLSNNILYNASSFFANSSRMLSKVYEIKLPDILTSYIRIQRPGVLTLCEVEVFKGVCELGRFGRDCAQSCHCADNKPCHLVSGHCQSKVCKTGWQGPSCSEKCPYDTFGDDCSGKCFCAEDTCTNNYGICPGKCRSGYHGPHCSEGLKVKTIMSPRIRISHHQKHRSTTLWTTSVVRENVSINDLVFQFAHTMKQLRNKETLYTENYLMSQMYLQNVLPSF